ncbi:hypothetical protein ACFU98_45970 [Streptomyces sp. NPDC057575]|uniref:hypothetical protein n=1 Tax=unclassified Streptomyces TaxID=2593676 RepID=UPI0036928597
MRVKRSLIVLGPGLLASMVLSPAIAMQASAAPEQTGAIAPSISEYVRQPNPDPSPKPDPFGSRIKEAYTRMDDISVSYQAWNRGFEAGQSAAMAGQPPSVIQIPPASHTMAAGQYYAGFRNGYYDYKNEVKIHAVEWSFGVAGQEYAKQRQKAIEEMQQKQAEGVRVEPLPKDQPVLPQQGRDTGLHQGQQLAPEGQGIGNQEGPTESTTPTHQTLRQQMMPGGGEATGQQQGSMTPTMPSHESEQGMYGGHESGSQQDFTESGPGESSGGSDAGAPEGGGGY